MPLPVIMRILPTKGTGVFRRDEPRRGGTPVSQRALGIFKANRDITCTAEIAPGDEK